MTIVAVIIFSSTPGIRTHDSQNQVPIPLTATLALNKENGNFYNRYLILKCGTDIYI